MWHRTTLLVFSWLAAAVTAVAADGADVIRRAKQATALVQAGKDGAGTAFCIAASGLFVTNEHVIRREKEGEITLVVNSGEENEKVIKARVVRSDADADLALLQATGSDFVSLDLGTIEKLQETTPVTAFGYPFGRLLAEKDGYPSITVTSGRVTSLRKVKGTIQIIQIDNSLNPGNSGGPLIDADGRVIGIVKAGIRATGVNFAIPVTLLTKLLDKPTIQFESTTVDEAEIRKPRAFPVIVTMFRKPAGPLKVELELQSGASTPRRFEARPIKEGRYEATAALVADPPGPEMVRVEAEFTEGTLTGRMADQTVKVGDDAIKLSQIHRIEPGAANEPPKVILSGAVRRGQLKGLEASTVRLGGVELKVDLSKAVRITFSRGDRVPANLTYRVLVREGERILGETRGPILITATQKPVQPNEPARVEGAFASPSLAAAVMMVPLPATIDRLAVGAGGRILVLHLKKPQQLAIFDVSQSKVIKYLPLPSNDILFAATARKLFVVLRDVNLIQRWDLKTLEREVSAPGPEGGIAAIAAGADSVSSLIALNGQQKKHWTIDVETLEFRPVSWRGWNGGAWGPVHGHVSFDGTSAVVCGGGWAGIEVATLGNGKVTSSRTGSSVQGDTLIAGNGALIFPEKGGIVRGDFSGSVSGIEGTPFPAIDSAFSLSLVTKDKKPGLILYSNSAPKPITTIRNLDELVFESPLPLWQRVLLIPRARVLITVGEGSDRLLLRPFDLAQALEAEGVDYFFVESAPVRTIERGGTYEYPVKVRSRKGSVRFSLQAAPEGMEISQDGVLTWNVPAQFKEDEVSVIVEISDSSEQVMFHQFKLSIQEPTPTEVAP